MTQNKTIVFSVISLALIIFCLQSIEGRHVKNIDESNLMKNVKHAGISDTNAATLVNVTTPILPPSVVVVSSNGVAAPPPGHDVGAFRPTTPGNSPGVGHSIHY